MRVMFTDSWNLVTTIQNVNSAYITDYIKTCDTLEILELSNSSNVVLALHDPVESDHIYVVLPEEEAISSLKHLMSCDYVDVTKYADSTFFNPTAFEENLEKYFKPLTGEK